MIRPLFTVALVLSMLLCFATAALWVRSDVVPGGDRLSRFFTARQKRYTLRSEAGRLSLFAPPPAPAAAHPHHGPRPLGVQPKMKDFATLAPAQPPLANETPATLLAGVRNDQVTFYCELEWRHRRLAFVAPPSVFIDIDQNSPAALFTEQRYQVPDNPRDASMFDPPVFTDGEMIPALLAALEDPDKFIATHFLLWERFEVTPRPSEFELCPDGSAAQTISGLRLTLRPPPAVPGFGRESLPCEPHWDASQMAAVQEHWHRRLDERVASVMYWQVSAAFLALPGMVTCLRTWRTVRRKRLRRREMCITCGYDLRASADRCPECGSPIPAKS